MLHVNPTMISERFALLLRHGIILAGFLGFLVGAIVGACRWSEVTLVSIVWKSALLCFVFAFLMRFVLMRAFDAYLRHLVVRKQEEKRNEAQASP
jgi:uncharacterized membrane protein YoaK (UPF0700 family)